MKPDWQVIKLRYIESDLGLRELARESRVSFHTLAKRSRREGWALGRRLAQRSATVPATTRPETATVASDITATVVESSTLPLPQRSDNLKVALVGELERDVQAVRQHSPDTLEAAAKRQTVLRDVAATARTCLGWGDEQARPLVRIDLLAQTAIISDPLPQEANKVLS